jgi:phosphate uptake regulator
MSTAINERSAADYSQILDMTARACQAAQQAAANAHASIARSTPEPLDSIKEREEELDTFDREINEGVTETVTHVPAANARELLACLKLVIELERIGDLLLGFANRFRACIGRLDPDDARDLSAMAAILERMLGDAGQAFSKRFAT